LTRKAYVETQRLVKAIIILIRNTTWRCGRLERLIVGHLRKKATRFEIPKTSVKEMLRNFGLTGKKKNDFLDAIKRLERRNIIRILAP
jgi:hypothetical protein